MLLKNLDYTLTSGRDLNPNNRKYTLLRSYKFLYRAIPIVIPKGYVWDGPSGLPLFPWSAKKWLEPSLQHDFIYHTKGKMEDVVITRREADEAFVIALRKNNVNPLLIWLIQVFLWRAFKKVWDSDTGTVKLSVLGRVLWPMFALIIVVLTSLSSLIVTYLH